MDSRRQVNMFPVLRLLQPRDQADRDDEDDKSCRAKFVRRCHGSIMLGQLRPMETSAPRAAFQSLMRAYNGHDGTRGSGSAGVRIGHRFGHAPSLSSRSRDPAHPSFRMPAIALGQSLTSLSLARHSRSSSGNFVPWRPSGRFCGHANSSPDGKGVAAVWLKRELLPFFNRFCGETRFRRRHRRTR